MEREYRMSELARRAGISVRTVRFYRERKLLPPPRREGRIAWYSEAHLARLRTINALLRRGHTLGGIADLLAAWDDGRGSVGELLGLDRAIAAPWSTEEQARLGAEDLAKYFGAELTPENMATAVDIGYVTVEGEEVVHASKRLLEASATLVGEGVPLAEVLAVGRRVRECADLLADLFTALIRTHVVDPVAASASELDADHGPRLAEALERVRPIARTVMEAELAMAMDRRVQAEVDTWLPPPPPPSPVDEGTAPAE